MLVFRPRLFEALRQCDRATFLSDLAAGIMVGAVALPLAITSGVEPSRGLWTAIIAGVMLVVMGVPRSMENGV
ncbi:MAG: SulP family inorganic anion transporter [Verrucomicrobiia bacterium]